MKPDVAQSPANAEGVAEEERPSTLEWAKRWLSPARLAPYLADCGGDVELALALHEWNLALGRAVMMDVAHFELALRNSYARVLRDGLGDGWLLDDSSPLRAPIMRMSKAKKQRDVNLVNRRAIDDAQRRARDHSNADQVVVGLTLGFWVHLTDRSRERDLWIPHLHKAWPVGSDRNDLNARLYAVNQLRNRVAHHERLFDPKDKGLSPRAVDADAVALLRDLHPEAYDRLFGEDPRTGVERFLDGDPAPVGVGL